MRLFKRTLPPAATPISFGQIISGFAGILHGEQERERFRSEIKDYFGVSHCFLVSSGKAALTIVLKALHEAHLERNEVIIPAFTCYSVPSAIKRAGLEIKLCDIDSKTLDFNCDQLEEILESPQAKSILAIIPRHIFGISADMDRLRRLANSSDTDISILEDAAQAMGGMLSGKKLGTLGDLGVFSLGRGKAFSTVEGGVIITRNDELADRIKRLVDNLPEYSIIEKTILLINAILLNIFMHPALFWLPKSLPFLKVGATIYDTGFAILRLSTFQAGLARGWQERLHSLIKIRSENAQYWRSCLEGVPTIVKLFFKPFPRDASKISVDADSGPVRFPAIIKDEFTAKKILLESESKGLGIMITYPDSVDGIPELSLRFKGQYFQVAKECAKKILTFPAHSYLAENDKAQIAQMLKSESKKI
jgi:perosamine synthetase